MVSHYPAKFPGYRHSGSGNMFLVPEEEDLRCCRFSPPLLFISKRHGLEEHGISY